MNQNSDPGVTIRTAAAPDADTLRRLATLDSRPEPDGRALLAERHGIPIAAISLTSGETVADPFTYTEQAVRLLRRRRSELLRQGRGVGPAHSLLRRLATAA